MRDPITLLSLAAIFACVLWCSCAIACRWTKDAYPLSLAALMTVGLGFFLTLMVFAAALS